MHLYDNPAEDGKTHIRIHRRAKTLLGRLLAESAQTPFTTQNGGEFQSLMAHRLWLARGLEDDSIRDLSLDDAEHYDERHTTELSRYLKQVHLQAMQTKVVQNQRLFDLVSTNAAAHRLPYSFYDVIDDGPVEIEIPSWASLIYDQCKIRLQDGYKHSTETPVKAKTDRARRTRVVAPHSLLAIAPLAGF